MTINSEPRRSMNGRTVPQQRSQAQILVQALRARLIQHQTKKREHSFTHTNLIKEVLNEEAVTALIREEGLEKQGTSSLLGYCDLLSGRAGSYLPTLAILILIDCSKHILSAIEEGIGEDNLPLGNAEHEEGSLKFCLRGNEKSREFLLECLETDCQRENFNQWQYRITTPRFTIDTALGGAYAARHEVYPAETILPWCNTPIPAVETQIGTTDNDGGYSQVKKAAVDDLSHDFGPVLSKLGLASRFFAVKTLTNQNGQNQQTKVDTGSYQNEVQLLKLFNTFRHPHLVMLLLSYQLGETYNLVFPLAKSNLKQFWAGDPRRDHHYVQWLANQLQGIVGALDVIHIPPHAPKKFGRHGDIKPENILLFDIVGKGERMVLSDMGLTKLHNEWSRSAQSPAGMHLTPTYRPPESDLEGNKISRSYDIWTVGCLLMETMVWLMGGHASLVEFSQDRMTVPDCHGCKTPTYFEIKQRPTQFLTVNSVYTASVKEEVLKWFDKIRGNTNCTRFVLDIMDIVQDEMLIVRSVNKERIRSPELVKKFKEIFTKCDNISYTQDKVTESPRNSKPIHVEVEMGKHVLDHMARIKVILRQYQGETVKSVSKAELGKPQN